MENLIVFVLWKRFPGELETFEGWEAQKKIENQMVRR